MTDWTKATMGARVQINYDLQYDRSKGDAK